MPQTQEGRAGEAHVSPAGEQTGADGAAGGTHEAAQGEMVARFTSVRAQLNVVMSSLANEVCACSLSVNASDAKMHAENSFLLFLPLL